MEIEKITIPNGINYLGEFTSQLPSGILNKGMCGCGGTTIALTNNENYIVVVPYVSLIVDKVSQLNNKAGVNMIFPVWGRVGVENDLKEYMSNDSISVKKIMCTYDSFSKVAEIIKGTTFKVLVDEYHTLLHSYSYRDEAIDNLLSAVKSFDYVTYMSATPLQWDYSPVDLQSLPVTEYEWEGSTKIKPQRFKTNQPYGKLQSIINNYKLGLVPRSEEGIKSKAMYIYLNSVSGIMNVIRQANLTPDEVRIMCADTSSNRSKLGSFEIESASDPEKTFNFITRSGFEGCDIYSETGMTYVVTNHTANTTLLDISTDISQIVGRIRTESNPFKNQVVHIYNTSLAEMSSDEFDEVMAQNIDESNALIDTFNSSNEIAKKALANIIKGNREATFMKIDNNKASLNDLAVKAFTYKYKEVRLSYNNGVTIRDKYTKDSKFDISSSKQEYSQDIFEYIKEMVTVGTFRDCAKEFCDLAGESLYYYKDEKIAQILTNYPEIEEIHAALGAAKMKALSYKKQDMVNAMKANSNDANTYIGESIYKCFRPGNRYSNKDAKERLQKLYDKALIKKKAKASDLNEWYLIKEAKVEGNRAIEIIRSLTPKEIKAVQDTKIMKRMMS